MKRTALPLPISLASLRACVDASRGRSGFIVYRLLLIGFCLIFFSLIISHSSFLTREALADGEFSTNYDVAYNVDQTGLTHISQKIELVNKTANFYAEKFELKIGSAKVKDVTASDNTGTLETETKFENNITTIGIKFNQKVIGAGKSLIWNLNYTSDELASKSGQIWEISIPRLARSADISDYKTKVSVPRTFGPIATTSPQPKDQTQSAQTQDFTFDRDQLFDSGIAMSFGEKQVFSFRLDYYLENNSFAPQLDEIALPPDNNFQKIVLTKLDPTPIDVVVDGDGNFLAKYRLASKKSVTIQAEGTVEVFSKPFRNIHKPLTASEKEAYLQPQRYWETDNGAIKDKANQLKTPDKIYDFVATYLKYNQERLASGDLLRKGATSAFAAPDDSVCAEFADLFIALARAAGIPAREVEGYAYTQNDRLRPLSLSINQGDILHAWAEYWDNDRGWIQIDPTWGSTSGGINYFEKLDFNHVTFVQKGLSSVNPAPAGAYKKAQDSGKKSVSVEFAKDLQSATVNPILELMVPKKIISAVGTKVDARIKNGGTTSILLEKVAIDGQKLSIVGPKEIDIPLLPPFANRVYTFRLGAAGFFERSTDNLILSYAGAQVSKQVTVEPFFKLFADPILALTIILLLITVTAAFFIHKKLRKKSSL